jgi:hypothetical protein
MGGFITLGSKIKLHYKFFHTYYICFPFAFKIISFFSYIRFNYFIFRKGKKKKKTNGICADKVTVGPNLEGARRKQIREKLAGCTCTSPIWARLEGNYFLCYK